MQFLHFWLAKNKQKKEAMFFRNCWNRFCLPNPKSQILELPDTEKKPYIRKRGSSSPLRMFLPSDSSSTQHVFPSECSSPQHVFPLRMFFPSERSFFSLRMFLPSECSFLQNIPSYKMLLPSNCSSLQNSLPFKIVLHCFFIQKVSHFRMFRIPEFSFLQNVFYDPSECSFLESDPPLRMFLPWKRSSRQNVPPLKAFLPLECSSLESVPPLRMFLPWKRSSPQNVPPLKAFLPSECFSLESVPPLRMFL